MHDMPSVSAGSAFRNQDETNHSRNQSWVTDCFFGRALRGLATHTVTGQENTYKSSQEIIIYSFLSSLTQAESQNKT